MKKLFNWFAQMRSSWCFGLFLCTTVLLSGCSSTPAAKNTKAEQPEDLEEKGGAGPAGGSQLWAARCAQCHYARDAGTFTAAQWEVIMLHMRMRANLPASEHEAILKFIKSAR